MGYNKKVCLTYLIWIFLIVIFSKSVYSIEITPDKIRIFTKEDGLRDDYTITMTYDKQDNLWIGTSTGCSKFDGKSFVNYGSEDGFSNKTVWAIFCDSSGLLWFGTEGDGLYTFDGESFKQYTRQSHGLSNDSYFDGFIFEDNMGGIWGGAEVARLFKYQNNEFIVTTEKVQGIIQDNENNMFAITFNGNKLFKFSESYNQFKIINRNLKATMDLEFGVDGSIWVAGDVNYLAHSVDQGRTFKKYYFDKKSVGTFWDLFIDNDNTVWAAFNDNVVSFNGKVFKYFERGDGLPIGHYKYIFQDKDGHLWFCCLGGLAVLDYYAPKLTTKTNIPDYVSTDAFVIQLKGDDGRFGSLSENIVYEYSTDNKESWQKAIGNIVYLKDLNDNSVYLIHVKATDECGNSVESQISLNVKIDPLVPRVTFFDNSNDYIETPESVPLSTTIKENYEIGEEDFFDFTNIHE